MTFTVRGIEFNDDRLAKLTCECLDKLANIGLYPYKLESFKIRQQNKKFGCCRMHVITADGSEWIFIKYADAIDDGAST